MDEWFENLPEGVQIFLGIIFSLLGMGVLFGPFIHSFVFKYKLKRLHKQSDDHLLGLLYQKKFIYFGPVLQELAKRGVDYRLTLPEILETFLDGNVGVRFLVWACVKNHFPDFAERFSVDPKKPTAEERAALRDLVNQMKSLGTPV